MSCDENHRTGMRQTEAQMESNKYADQKRPMAIWIAQLNSNQLLHPNLSEDLPEDPR